MQFRLMPLGSCVNPLARTLHALSLNHRLGFLDDADGPYLRQAHGSRFPMAFPAEIGRDRPSRLCCRQGATAVTAPRTRKFSSESSVAKSRRPLYA